MIPGSPAVENCDALRGILDALREKYPRPTYGGLWALAGFSLQTGIFLLHFYRNLSESRPLPSIEVMSDIVCPADKQLNVIVQVKRTLTRIKLAQALKEFALIIRLIHERDETPLLRSLRFQVACGKREANVEWPWPADAALADEIRSTLDEVEAYQADPFILEQADPLEDLWDLLWSQGVRDPQAIIRYAAGRLLESFGRPDRVSSVHHELISSFENASRRAEKRCVVSLLLAEDVTPDPNADSLRKIVVGSGFGFSELRQGCFRNRPLIFADLWTNFSSWLSEHQSPILHREIPVFWIDGRSGEGKSVLLRQLVAHLLRYQDRFPVFEIDREDVPKAIKERRQALDRPALLVTDDLYAVHNRESWGEQLAQSVETDLPLVCVLTCGPTEQREEFERRFTEPFHLTRFTVPPFKETERQEFVDWFTHRVGRTAERKTLTTENTLLVQLMFELSEGTTLVEFARRFRKRLDLSGARGAVQRILSLSALYLETPLDFLIQTDERDAISRLSQDDQRHFRLGTQSVNFAHAHLAGELLRPILGGSYPRVSWEIAWARELSAVLAVPRERLPAYTHENVVTNLTLTSRLSTGERRRALKELYESHIATNHGRPAAYLLPNWFRALISDPALSLHPSPIDYACAAIASAETSEQFPPQVAVDLWRLRGRTRLTPGDLEQACWSLLSRTADQCSGGPSVIVEFLRAASQPHAYRRRALEWLDNHAQHPQTFWLLASLVASAPADVAIRDRAVEWLDNNAQHPRARQVLGPLVASAPANVGIRDRAVDWLANNAKDPQAYQMLVALVASARADVAIRDRALKWLDTNAQHPQARQLLAALVASAPANVAIRDRALEWLDSNVQDTRAYQVLAPLVASAPGDVAIGDRARNWLDSNAQHPQLAQLLSVMIARSPDDQAEEWIRKGIEYISVPERKECAWILAVTLNRSKARHDLIDRALALAALPAVERQRGQLTRAIAEGVLRYAARLSDLVATLEAHPPAIIFMVLGQCIRVGASTPEFLTYLAHALNRGFRKPGYGAILRTLRNYPVVWKDIEPDVFAAIKEDFARTPTRQGADSKP
jgi:hypothetical protein